MRLVPLAAGCTPGPSAFPAASAATSAIAPFAAGARPGSFLAALAQLESSSSASVAGGWACVGKPALDRQLVGATILYKWAPPFGWCAPTLRALHAMGSKLKALNPGTGPEPQSNAVLRALPFVSRLPRRTRAHPALFARCSHQGWRRCAAFLADTALTPAN